MQLKQRHGLNTVVLTFDPHPRKILFPEQKELRLLTHTEEKLDLLENYGVDVTIVYPFDKEFSSMEAEDYIQHVLIKSLKVKYLVIGYDHHFGHDRGGNIELLRQVKDKYGYEVEEIDALDIDSIKVSSSRIRKAVESGNIEEANEALGHYYFMYALVSKGKQLGSSIGYPTANLQIDSPDKLIPKRGVYFVEVVTEGDHFFGMMNIGYNPTTDNSPHLRLEVHIFNFDGDLYGKFIRVNFIEYLREEKKFSGVDELRKALDADKEKCLLKIEEINSRICTVIKK
jgi:riboflavin kinase/FMN adenylyltransferase